MDYANAGIEPPMDEVMEDPIVLLLRRYDGLSEHAWHDSYGETSRPLPLSRAA